ncbi:2,3-diaminopropionate biosynthesis protein SbnA [Fluviispira multicolorata]|uniref:2,3-diaminopropionate biosynthesis protein SbnA n=1 Tax=Fluviispira multicolorata TaxID=2654512 RepID=A0A833JBK7_9BACT|nr:2,3-diaminopropionate biosynthesis protein SbnA [Fluviispira multicolorata]KAB8029691.1 2,3-diaminopropionate biosynthesis protein SbnA [Fluviispira multicolorata]
MFLENLNSKLESLQSLVGNTPLKLLRFKGLNLFAKLEFMNPVGSVKDRPALRILYRALQAGKINEKTLIVESSSGNFASALAIYCRELGLNFIPIIDPNISSCYEDFLRITCDEVIKVQERDETGGYLLTRLAAVRRICSNTPNNFWPNQYENIECMWAHYFGGGAELVRDLPKLDYVFLGVSSGGTISGISRRLKEDFPDCKVVAVDVEGSVIFGGPASKRYIPGIGASLRPSLLNEAKIDEVVYVTERASVDGCLELLHQHGLFVGGSTGSVYAAIKSYFSNRLPMAKIPTVAFLCADRGTAYLDKVFNSKWVESTYPSKRECYQ